MNLFLNHNWKEGFKTRIVYNTRMHQSEWGRQVHRTQQQNIPDLEFEVSYLEENNIVLKLAGGDFTEIGIKLPVEKIEADMATIDAKKLMLDTTELFYLDTFDFAQMIDDDDNIYTISTVNANYIEFTGNLANKFPFCFVVKFVVTDAQILSICGDYVLLSLVGKLLRE